MASLPGNPSHMNKEGFVQPSSYLRPRGQSQPMPHAEPESAIERDQRIGLVCVGPDDPSHRPYSRQPRSSPQTSPPTKESYDNARAHADDSIAQHRIRDFLKIRTSYDVLPLSFRLIIFDTALLVKRSLAILIQNGMF